MSEDDSYETTAARFKKGAEAIDAVQKAVRAFFAKEIIFDKPSLPAARQVTFSEDITSMTIRTFMEQYLDPMVFDTLKMYYTGEYYDMIDSVRNNYGILLNSLKAIAEKGHKAHINKIVDDIHETDYTIDDAPYPGTLYFLSELISNRYVEILQSDIDVPPELEFINFCVERCSQAFSLSVVAVLEQHREALGLNPGSDPGTPPR